MESVMTAQSHTIPRTGELPVEFTGNLLAYDTSQQPKLNHWHEVAVYRTVKGSYVVHVAFRTSWKTESPSDWVTVAKSLPDVAAELLDYDPAEGVSGPPQGMLDWERRQEEVRNAAAERYDTLVSRVLAKLPGAGERIG